MTSTKHGPTRVAIVTGAGGAIGKAISQRLLDDGLFVALADLDADAVEEAARQVGPTVGRCLPLTVDVRDHRSTEAMVEAVLDETNRIDVLINNAGISEGHQLAWELDPRSWADTIDVNLTGVFNCCRAVLPYMLEHHWGRIVNVSSIAALRGKDNPPAYAASKAGVIGLTKSIAHQVAHMGVLVNAIVPGAILTEAWSQLPDVSIHEVAKRHPIGRLGRVEEVAALVSWLSSDECSFSTGAVFDITGGRSA